MKRLILPLLICTGLLGAGCNKWLDVKPQGQITKDELFTTEKGFRDALTGAYIRLNSSNTYGSNLTWGAVEYLACNWDIAGSSNTTIPQLKNANYTNEGVRQIMDDIYQGLYKGVADVNDILAAIDAKQTVFAPGNYALVKGEALAIRAFCHFDVLRLFGPMPNNPGGDKILPYVTSVTTDIHPGLSYAEYAQQLLADLDNAELLLKQGDPILQYSLLELNPPGTDPTHVVSDSYWAYRQLRFNYYALLALRARVATWLSVNDAAQKQNAAKYAQMVIDGKDRNGQPTFRLGTNADISSGDYTMTPEHLMALSVYNLSTIASNTFGDGQNGLMRYDFKNGANYYYLGNLFPPNESTSDIRYVGMWLPKTVSGQTDYLRFNKYIQRTDKPFLQVPLLRLSEMYLVLTEAADNKAAAEAAYSAYCSKKGIPFTAFGTDWQTDRRNKMLREYAREFYAEGQAFLTYKRYNVTTLPSSWTSTYYSAVAARYVVPKPLREINYRNK
jgi:hypothetical protein